MTNEKIFNDNIKLAYMMANRYRTNYLNECEDITQIALEGLWIAIINYNGNTKFSTYACIVIDNNIRRYIRKIKNKKDKTVYMQDKANEDFTYADGITDYINYEEMIIEKIDYKILNDAIISNKINLKPKEKQILSLRMKNKKQMEIASELGMTQGGISRIEKKIKNKVISIINQGW